MTTNHQLDNFFMEDESIGLLNYDPLKTYTVSLMLLSSLLTGTFIRVLILKYIQCHSPKERPINRFVIFDQTVLMVCKLVFTTLTLVSIWTGTPLQELFGETTCIILWISYFFHNGIGVVSGVGMAIYRTMIICAPIVTHVKIGKLRLMRLIFIAEMAIFCTVLYYYWMGLKIANNAVAFQFCHGYSPVMAREIWLYEGGTEANRDIGYMYQLVSLLIGTLMIVLEFGLYTLLFLYLIKYDKEAATKGLVSVDTAKDRRQNNVTSLSGQAIAFVIEVLAAYFVIATMNSPKFLGVERVVYVVITPITSTLVAATLFFTSPQLKRHYLVSKTK